MTLGHLLLLKYLYLPLQRRFSAWPSYFETLGAVRGVRESRDSELPLPLTPTTSHSPTQQASYISHAMSFLWVFEPLIELFRTLVLRSRHRVWRAISRGGATFDDEYDNNRNSTR